MNFKYLKTLISLHSWPKDIQVHPKTKLDLLIKKHLFFIFKNKKSYISKYIKKSFVQVILDWVPLSKI